MDKFEQRARELLVAECPECGGNRGYMVTGGDEGCWKDCGTCRDGERLESVNRTQALRAIATALREQAGAVPEGWKLVPAEVTDAMREAFHDWRPPEGDNYAGAQSVSSQECWGFCQRYDAMLAAAPSPPVEQAAGGGVDLDALKHARARMDYVTQYASDTLSGPSEPLNDRAGWYREGVVEILRRARAVAAELDSIIAAAPPESAMDKPIPEGVVKEARCVVSYLDHACMDTSKLPGGMAGALRRLREAITAAQHPPLRSRQEVEEALQWAIDAADCSSHPFHKAYRNTLEELLAQHPTPRPQGEVVVTRTEDGEIVAVTRQDEDGRVLSVIAESMPAANVSELRAEVERLRGRLSDMEKSPAGMWLAKAERVEAEADALLKALRIAVLALGHADAKYRAAYEAVSDAIDAAALTNAAQPGETP